MAPVLRGGLLLGVRTKSSQLPVCTRCLTTTPSLLSGHNRWSKIRHQKGSSDSKKSALRSHLTKDLTLWSRLYGGNIEHNPRLAAAVNVAKKSAIPKAVIEAAIQRGQGRSLDGRNLEPFTCEIMMAPSVAMLIDIETDNKARVMIEVNALLKKYGGSVASTMFLFTRRGKVVFGVDGADIGINDIMLDAIEAGAEDLEQDEDGSIVAWTEPSMTTKLAQDVEAKFGLKPTSSDIVWAPNSDTTVPVDSVGDLEKMADLAAALQEYPDVQAVYSNATRGSVSEDDWARLEENLDV